MGGPYLFQFQGEISFNGVTEDTVSFQANFYVHESVEGSKETSDSSADALESQEEEQSAAIVKKVPFFLS